MELTEEQEKELFKEKVSSYTIKIFVVSGKRFRFDTVGELGAFYAEKIKSVTREELYGLLLSLIQYEERCYDVDGHFMGSKIKLQEICGDKDYDVVPRFSMETMDEVWKNLEKNMESTGNEKGHKNNSPGGSSAGGIM